MGPIPILFDHPDFLVVNKPIGLTMHHASKGIVAVLRLQTAIQTLHLVHRLDDHTSGCLILAKNSQAAAYIGQLFEQHKIQKFYIALIDKKPKKKQGRIIGDMEKSRDGSYKLSKQQNNPAITFFFSETLATAAPSIAPLRLVFLRPITGKTHQLRVALKSLGSAILGDQRYKGSHSDRMYLHSYQINFLYQHQDICVNCLSLEGEHFQSISEQQLQQVNTLPWPAYKRPEKAIGKGKLE